MPFNHAVIYELIYDQGDVDDENNNSSTEIIKKINQYLQNPYITGDFKMMEPFVLTDDSSDDSSDDESDNAYELYMEKWIQWFDANNHGNKIKLEIVKLINTIGIQHMILNHKLFKSYKFKSNKYEEITSAAYKWFITNFDMYWLGCECIQDLLFDNHINNDSMKKILKCLKDPLWEFE